MDDEPNVSFCVVFAFGANLHTCNSKAALKNDKCSMAVMFGCVWMCNVILGRFEIAVEDELHGVFGVLDVFGALGVLEASR